MADLVPDLSRSRAAQLIREGRVRVDGAMVRKPSSSVGPPMRLTVYEPPPIPSEAVAEDLSIEIVHEDEDLVVVNKPAGMVVHPAAGHPTGTLVNALLHRVGDLSGIGGAIRPGIVHRLDRGTSGLLVVAKHDVAHRHLQRQFAEHSAGRRYLAITVGAPKEPSGTIHSWLSRHPRDRKRFASTEAGQGKEAITHWWCRSRGASWALVECALQTGRTHQVRVHLSEQGWPLLGDGAYGSRPSQAACRVWHGDGSRPMLHAWQLRLRHPSREAWMRWVVPPPPDMQDALDALELVVPDPDDVQPRPEWRG